MLAALFTTDSGGLTSAELVRRLHVSPASVSKAPGHLETQALVRPERDPHSRAERYAVDADVAFRPVMADVRNQPRIAEACGAVAQKLGTTAPAGARLEITSQFLLHVTDDLARSARQWHRIYSTDPRKTSGTDD
ncbi:hypothetical protein GCM10009663_39320 [Kitasatospora arboriphila]|uniref:HTH marR-type domain-containing protein n=1 Tax=Kitasatospora arboriphila TaxID=258052 RepID=A0ABN1TKC0_9ACTN